VTLSAHGGVQICLLALLLAFAWFRISCHRVEAIKLLQFKLADKALQLACFNMMARKFCF
jgi:hypothetical protein